MRAFGLPKRAEICIMGPGQEIGTVPLVASPITNDAQSASDVLTKV